MAIGDGSSRSSDPSARKREYTAESVSRHRTGAGSARRKLFFGLAATWGFVVGVSGLLLSMSLAGQPANPSEAAMPGLLVSFLVTIAGGYVMAAAYAETKRRSRR